MALPSRRAPLVAAMCVWPLAVAASDVPNEPVSASDWTFRVLLDGQPIGEHRFRLSGTREAEPAHCELGFADQRALGLSCAAEAKAVLADRLPVELHTKRPSRCGHGFVRHIGRGDSQRPNAHRSDQRRTSAGQGHAAILGWGSKPLVRRQRALGSRARDQSGRSRCRSMRSRTSSLGQARQPAPLLGRHGAR